LESGCEMFLTAREAEHTFKISNSMTAGSVSTTPAHQPSQEVIAQVEAERQQRQQQRKQQRQQPPEPTPTAQNPPTQNPNSQATSPNSPTQQAARPTRMTRPPGLRPVPPAIPIPNGTKLMATPDSKEWFPATVVASRGDDQIQVSWDQGDRPDEFLHRAKLAIDPRVLVRLRAAGRRQR